MAEMKFNCPGCGQVIAADELWAGHQIQCPICNKELIVPQVQAAASPGAPAAASGNPLVPQVPASAPKLSIGSARHQPSSPPPQASPHSTLAKAAANLGPNRKKENPIKKFVGIGIAVLVVGVGVYFAWPYVSKFQKKTSETEVSGTAGQVGHISELNSVLDATDPDKGGGLHTGSSTRRRAAGAGAVAGTTAAADTANLPVVAPTYSLDPVTAAIPESKVNGVISGTNFVAEHVRLDPSGPALVLSAYKGDLKAPDSQVIIYLRLKAGEKPAGRKWSISPDTKGSGVTVAKRWKIDPRYAPKLQNYTTGFALKLELGEIKDGYISGKMFLSLPDTEKTVVAGMFNATTTLTDAPAATTTAAAPAAPQAPPPTAARTAAPERYGIAQ